VSLENAYLLVNVNPTLFPDTYIAAFGGIPGRAFESKAAPRRD
jgi:hypothetical protein